MNLTYTTNIQYIHYKTNPGLPHDVLKERPSVCLAKPKSKIRARGIYIAQCI